jgi:N-acetylglucosaminyldiphosphoundecaprenol N-acetyl-beta-D-mannosaminyltransferase
MLNESSVQERPKWPISLLGVPFDNVTTNKTVEKIADMVRSRRPHYLVTANVDFLIQARLDIELQRILIEADLVLCDGTPLLWASRGLGNALPERVAGSDLVPLLMADAAQRGHRVFLLGGGQGVGAQAAQNLLARHPEIQVDHFSPPFSALLEMDNAEIHRRIADARPDVLLVGFGCPKQEKWIAMNYRQLGVPVVIGVGATLDFLAERVKRAPHWMRGIGAEWLFRLAQEPRRLAGRYFSDLVHFLPAIGKQWVQGRALRRKLIGQSAVSTSASRDWRQVRITGHLGAGLLEREGDLFREIVADTGRNSIWRRPKASTARRWPC